MVATLTRSQRILFLSLAGTTAIYLLARAMRVPMVHDESASVLWFVRSGAWLPYLAHWDANDHYLSSGIGILFTGLFGESLIALRAGSLLGFVAYAWATWRIGARFQAGPVRACMWVALLLCPFLLDFFALFRGYGLELAGWMIALDGLLRYTAERTSSHGVQVLVGMLLAGSAIVALLPAWGLVLLVLAWLMWEGRHRITRRALFLQTIIFFLLGVLPVVLATGLAFELKARGLLYHGGTEGFFTVTFGSLCRYVLGSGSAWVVGAVFTLLVFAGATAVREVVRTRRFDDPLVLINSLLWSDAVLRVLMATLLGVNFPEDRAALHFVPLALLSIAFALDRLSLQRAWIAWGATILLVLPIRAVLTANIDHTTAWPEQSVPTRFLSLAEDLEHASPRPLLIGGQHQLALCWPMSAGLQGKVTRSLQTVGFPEGTHDLRVVDARFLREASEGYHVIDSAMGPGLWLLQRDQRAETVPAGILRAPERSTREEFDELAQLPVEVLGAGEALVEVKVALILPSSSPDVRLVIEVNDAEGNKLFYDAVAPMVLRSAWAGQRLRRVWGLPHMPKAARAIIYLYNPAHVVVSHGAASTSLYAVRR